MQVVQVEGVVLLVLREMSTIMVGMNRLKWGTTEYFEELSGVAKCFKVHKDPQKVFLIFYLKMYINIMA